MRNLALESYWLIMLRSDNKGDKPWLDDATNAQWTFWSDVGSWLPTWGKGDARGLTVSSVKMWERGACSSSSDL